MLRIMCKSKIHMAAVTKKELRYKGSVGVDSGLLKKADILPGERVQVVNVNNGERFETYAIGEAPGSGTVCLYGPAARMGEIGDKVVILSYALYDNKEALSLRPVVVRVNDTNKPVKG